MSRQTANFRDLRASFESRGQATTGTTYSSTAGDLANMSVQPQRTRVPSLAKSIDSVLDTPAASQPVRPIARLRPSWIGPLPSERPITPGVQAMKQQVTVGYSSPGLQPPVYVCTNLSDPEWDPVEMHRELDEHGGNVFFKAFRVEDGEYQYKFRLGEGDWWACDESKPTVDDGQGNRNNLLIVTSPLAPPEQPKTAPIGLVVAPVETPAVSQAPHVASPTPLPSINTPSNSDPPKTETTSAVVRSADKQTASPAPGVSPSLQPLPLPTPAKSEQPKTSPASVAVATAEQQNRPQQPAAAQVPQPTSMSTPAKTGQPKPNPTGAPVIHPEKDAAAQAPGLALVPQPAQAYSPPAPAPLLKHEALKSPNSATSEQTPEREMPNPLEVDDEEPGNSHQEMLLKHETLKSQSDEDEESAPEGEDSSSSSDEEDGNDKDTVDTPLLRHETAAKIVKKQEPAPLFRHESMKPNQALPTLAIPPTKNAAKPALSATVAPHASPHDPSLEKFPTHQAGIIELIMDTHQRLPEDETSDDTSESSAVSQTFGGYPVSAQALASVREAREEEEILAEIREAEEEEYEREEADGDEVDPLKSSAPMTPSEPEDADFKPKIDEKIEIEEHIVIEVVGERKGVMEVLLDKVGGTGNAIALAVGLLVIAAGICTMQFL